MRHERFLSLAIFFTSLVGLIVVGSKDVTSVYSSLMMTIQGLSWPLVHYYWPEMK